MKYTKEQCEKIKADVEKLMQKMAEELIKMDGDMPKHCKNCQFLEGII